MNKSLMCFNKILRKSSIITCVIDIMKIPLGIFSARMIAKVVTSATKGIIDEVIKYSILLLVILLIFRFFYTLITAYSQKLSFKSKYKCKKLLYKQFFNQPLYALYNSNNGESIEKLNDDFDTVTSVSLSLYPSFIVSILTITVYMTYFVYYSPLIALTLLIIALIQIIPPIIVKKYMEKLYVVNREIEAKVTDFIISGYDGLSTIKLFNLKKWYMRKLQGLEQKEIKAGILNQVANQSETAMDNMIECILKYGTYGCLGLFVLKNFVSLDVAISTIALSTGFYGAVKSIFSLIPDFNIAKIATDRLDVWFKDNISLVPCKPNNKIVIDRINFDYKGKQILSNVSEQISCDKITLIYGGNGVGKSTLIKCLLGILPVYSGQISLDGLNPIHISDNYFNRNIVYLPQDDPAFRITPIELFQMTDKVNECKRIALEFGLAQELLDNNMLNDLSGGERKKVFLSMAFGVNKRLIFLDEPTNSLDEYGKSIFMKKLKERGRGTIIITHDNELKCCGSDVLIIHNGGIYRNEKIYDIL